MLAKEIAKSAAGCLTGASPLPRTSSDGQRGASRSQNSQQGGERQGPALLSPIPLGRSLPQGEVTPPKFQVVSSGPFCGCLECQHMPPAVEFSSKPGSGGLPRSSRYMVHRPGWAVGWGYRGAQHTWAPLRLAGRRTALAP